MVQCWVGAGCRREIYGVSSRIGSGEGLPRVPARIGCGRGELAALSVASRWDVGGAGGR